MPQQRLNIVPPLKGFCEANSYVAQPDGTSPDLRNVMLLDPATGRFRPAQRAGGGLYDLYNFALGSYTLARTLTIGGGGTTGPVVNIPTRGCTTISITGNLGDINLPETVCDPTTLPIDPGPPGDDTTGSLVLTPPGGFGPPVIIPIRRPVPGSITIDPAKPWMLVRNCTTKDDSFWVTQSVLAVHNDLPSLKVDGTCYYVTGKRTADPANPDGYISGGTINGGVWTQFIATGMTISASNIQIGLNCTDCSTAKICMYHYTREYNCGTNAWNDRVYVGAVCAQESSIPDTRINQWELTSFNGANPVYTQYATAFVDCANSGDCTSPVQTDDSTLPETGSCNDDPCVDPCCTDIRVVMFPFGDAVIDGNIVDFTDADVEGSAQYDSSSVSMTCPSPVATRGGDGFWSFTASIVAGNVTIKSSESGFLCPPFFDYTQWTIDSEPSPSGSFFGNLQVVETTCCQSYVHGDDTPPDDILFTGWEGNIQTVLSFSDTPNYPVWNGQLTKRIDIGSETWGLKLATFPAGYTSIQLANGKYADFYITFRYSSKWILQISAISGEGSITYETICDVWYRSTRIHSTEWGGWFGFIKAPYEISVGEA